MIKYQHLEGSRLKIYSATSYLEVLKEKIHENSGIRGYQARLAEAAGVHGSYISRVVANRVHLTPDQAANLAQFWGLDDEETDFFLDLVLLERSASKPLRARISRRIAEVRARHERIESRFPEARKLETSDAGPYYSAWYFSAIHMMLTIPRYRQPRAIAERLRLPESLVESALHALAELGLAARSRTQWQPVAKDLHIPERRMWARIQHEHWRQKSALKIQEADPDAVHYSGVQTLSLADARRLRSLVLQFLEDSRRLVERSPTEEEICFLGCDFYVL